MRATADFSVNHHAIQLYAQANMPMPELLDTRQSSYAIIDAPLPAPAFYFSTRCSALCLLASFYLIFSYGAKKIH